MGPSTSWPSTDTDPAMEEARLGGAAHVSRRLVPRRRQVLSDNGVKIPLLSDEAFCRRVRRFHRIVMIGASHMRYIVVVLVVFLEDTVYLFQINHD